MQQPYETHSIVLVPRGAALETSADDPVRYYYRSLTARLYCARLRLATELLGRERFGSLLEVGYGSGIFVPELARHAGRVTGIDVHDDAPRIRCMLQRFGVDAELHKGSLFAMPFPEASFDGLVCVSVLEHLTELDAAFGEFRRVLRPGGVAVVGFPVRNVLTDSFFRLVGHNPRALHPSSHTDILAAAQRAPDFTVERLSRLPRFLPLFLSAYVGCRCRAV